MATFTTGGLSIPDQILNPWLGKVKYGSAVATLSGAEPMKFGTGSWMTFDIGEAEYVGEGANKGPSEISAVTKRVKPYKFHKTVRMTEEVKWADEDHQLQAIDQVLAAIQPALSRALDFGIFHGINPTGGAAVAEMAEKLSDTTQSVTVGAGDKPYVALDAADQLVLASRCIPSGLAADPAFAAQIGGARAAQTEVKLYPDFTYATAPAGHVEGHTSSVSDTVGAVGVAADATGIVGFVGDFSAVRWGIQRQIGLELIEYGDPDGGGDLKRNNQIAFRAEVLYGWGIADTSAFAKLVTGGTDNP